VLAQNITGATAARVTIKIMIPHCVQCRDTFHHLKAVRGNQPCFGRRVVPVVGASDPLDKAFDVLWGTDLNDQINVAPINPKVE
jgi:hypothetical protein